jgi:hypothetical protein
MKAIVLAAAIAAFWGLSPALADPPAAAALTCAPPPGPPPESSRPAPMGPSPSLPPCATSRTKMCKKTEVDSFNADVATYNQQVVQRNAASKAYVDALNNWELDVNAYAQCELRLLNQETQKTP